MSYQEQVNKYFDKHYEGLRKEGTDVTIDYYQGGGGCDTCGYGGEPELIFSFTDRNGQRKTISDYYWDFGELIRELVEL